MRFFNERFGIQEIRLSNKEKLQLKEELKLTDYKRITFIAFVSVIVVSIFLVLDLISCFDEHKVYYIIFDIVLLVFALLVLLDSHVSGKNESKNSYFIKHINRTYPFIMIIWATAISTLNPGSVLNIATYYFVVFLIAFSIVTHYLIFISYFLVAITVYASVNLITRQEFFSETFSFICIGGVLSLMFYRMFITTRINAISAIIKLNKANQNLETKISDRTVELKTLNNELENEITHRKEAEKQMITALKIAESNNKLKSEFLANISHEVRTPLNAIIGFTEMMIEDGVSEIQKKEYQKLVTSNTIFLLSTFNDIFDASYVRTEKFKPINRLLSVNDFLDELDYETRGITQKYNKPNVAFEIVKYNNNNLVINTDEFLLKKAMLRLIDNAFKFTHQGKVEIGIKKLNNHLKIYVSDTGIGIQAKDHKKIFQPFVQGDGSFSRGYGGSGLGLTIVKGVTDALECDFNFESTPEVGSLFSLTFKIEN